MSFARRYYPFAFRLLLRLVEITALVDLMAAISSGVTDFKFLKTATAAAAAVAAKAKAPVATPEAPASGKAGKAAVVVPEVATKAEAPAAGRSSGGSKRRKA